MKKLKVLIMFFISFIFLSNLTPVYAAAADHSIPADSGNQVIQIDGSFDDWVNVPYSYEYNWDNPYIFENQWNPVTQKNETVTITDENGKPYNTTIRHKMSLYRDDKYVYVHIIMAKNWYTSLNGYDYQFWCDGQMAAFQVVLPGGGTITNGSFGAGLHPVEVRHRDSGISNSIAKDSLAMLKRNAGGINDELELKIPYSEFQRQNQNIDPGNIRVLEFFTPNLMYRRIACAGTDTAPYIGITVCAAIAGVGYLFYKKKGKLTV
nr:Firmicu-CTERM sorting domain-containing protein [uncultured Caproiciproducens sp.]